MSIAKNTTYNLAGSIIPMAVSLLTVPLYLSAIGLERYGILALCWLMLGYLGFLELGMGPAVQQRIASLRSADPEARSRVFWTALGVNTIAGVVGGAILLFAAPMYFATVDVASDSLAREIATTVPWLAAIVPVVMLNSIAMGAMKGREQFLRANLVSSGSSVAMAILPLCVAYAFGPRLDWLIATSLATRMGAILVQFAQCRRAVPVGRPQLPDRATLRSLLTFGGWVSANSFARPFMQGLDRIVIGSLMGAAAVSIYVIPANLVAQTKVLPEALASALFPRFASLPLRDRQRLEIDALRAVASGMTPLTLAALLVIGPFLHIWIGPTLARQSEPIACILLLGYWFNAFARVGVSRLQGEGRPDLVTKIVFAQIPFYFAALYFGLREFGLQGAAWAWALRAAAAPVGWLVLTGAFASAVRILWLPLVLVVSSTAAALLLPGSSPLRWAVLIGMAAGGLVLAWRTSPEAVRQIWRKAASRLTRLQRKPV